ncbi:MAG: ATP-dependent Clp protease ATP-binding subunit, partial [Spirochaetales bacterium]|nr:ATP-dependent Clp protease ATP-binding subunit [Spirochaetales bacterium]
VDEIVVFHPLEKEQVRMVLELELSLLRRRLTERGVAIELDTKAVEKLVEDGYDEAYGARPMRRLITKTIEDPLAAIMVEGSCPPGSTVRVREKGGELVIKVIKPPKSAPVEVAGLKAGR